MIGGGGGNNVGTNYNIMNSYNGRILSGINTSRSVSGGGSVKAWQGGMAGWHDDRQGSRAAGW